MKWTANVRLGVDRRIASLAVQLVGYADGKLRLRVGLAVLVYGWHTFSCSRSRDGEFLAASCANREDSSVTSVSTSSSSAESMPLCRGQIRSRGRSDRVGGT